MLIYKYFLFYNFPCFCAMPLVRLCKFPQRGMIGGFYSVEANIGTYTNIGIKMTFLKLSAVVGESGAGRVALWLRCFLQPVQSEPPVYRRPAGPCGNPGRPWCRDSLRVAAETCPGWKRPQQKELGCVGKRSGKRDKQKKSAAAELCNPPCSPPGQWRVSRFPLRPPSPLSPNSPPLQGLQK